jgi:hypothetical protein
MPESPTFDVEIHAFDSGMRISAAADRGIPGEGRRNSFTGLVELNRFCAGRKIVAVRQTTIQQTMPGSVRQSSPLARTAPVRSGGAKVASYVL